jgi:uncharacterized metal-binding protein
MTGTQRVVIVPCSGIGKTYGTVSREAAYNLTQDLRPEGTKLVALSLLVLGDEQACADVAESPAVTIDGCKLACASKMVAQSGGRIAREVAVLDVYRQHRALKPEGISELNEAGLELAQVLAVELAEFVDGIEGQDGEGNHA